MLYRYRVIWMNDYRGFDNRRVDTEDGFVSSDTQENALKRVHSFYGGDECVISIQIKPYEFDILPLDEVLYGVTTEKYLPGLAWQEMGRFAR